MKSSCIFLVCLLMAAWTPAAQGQTVTKEKKISGRFSGDLRKLAIDNRYGKLDINTWDRHEVTVDITVTAKARSAGEAQGILDKVRIIEPGAKDKDIDYKTVIGKSPVSEEKSEMRIDYVVNMPRRLQAELSNKYGDIDLSEVSGKLDIDLKYGALKTAAIRGNDNDISIAYGKATIASIEAGSIQSAYSRLSIDRAGSIRVSNQFEKTIIGTVRDLDIEQKYGDLKVGSVSRLTGNVVYADLTVEKLLKSSGMTLKYCGNARFDYVGPEVDNIDMTTSYGNLYYHFDDKASLSAVAVVVFGKLKNDAGNVSLAEQSGKSGHTSTTYKGRVGSGRGTMELTANYGNITFR